MINFADKCFNSSKWRVGETVFKCPFNKEKAFEYCENHRETRLTPLAPASGVRVDAVCVDNGDPSLGW